MQRNYDDGSPGWAYDAPMDAWPVLRLMRALASAISDASSDIGSILSTDPIPDNLDYLAARIRRDHESLRRAESLIDELCRRFDP